MGRTSLISKFEVNFDYFTIKYKQWHNWGHLIGTFLLSLLFYKVMLNDIIGSAILSWGCWWVWEIGDGLKPWYYLFKWNDDQSKVINILRRELLYSDKYSVQDVYFWNLLGAILFILFLI